jgi:pantoate--beta-alanine ligase
LKIFYKIEELQNQLLLTKNEGKKIGFVPTMGALHEGHVSLLLKSKRDCDLSIVSIFVNPTQFNNSKDFHKYPKKTDEDLKILEENGCDFVFLPSKEEIYSDNYCFSGMNLGVLDEVLEGKFRPGHFKGVIQVVHRLFEIVKPTNAYFGLKDFQQLAVIQKMNSFFKLGIKIIPCETVREKDGLAMSSRNLRLNTVERENALFIYKSLHEAKVLSKKLSPFHVKKSIQNAYASSKLSLEYFEIIDGNSFESLDNNWSENAIACVVAYSGEVRLIDNLYLKQ